MQANRIGLPHLEHGRIPISARLYSGFGWIDDIMLPLYWAGALPISLSPITACSDGDGASLAQYTSTRLVNIDHYWKFRSARMAPVWGTLRPSMQEALGGKAIHAALRSLTSICSGLLDCGAESVLQVRGPELT